MGMGKDKRARRRRVCIRMIGQYGDGHRDGSEKGREMGKDERAMRRGAWTRKRGR